MPSNDDIELVKRNGNFRGISDDGRAVTLALVDNPDETQVHTTEAVAKIMRKNANRRAEEDVAHESGAPARGAGLNPQAVVGEMHGRSPGPTQAQRWNLPPRDPQQDINPAFREQLFGKEPLSTLQGGQVMPPMSGIQTPGAVRSGQGFEPGAHARGIDGELLEAEARAQVGAAEAVEQAGEYFGEGERELELSAQFDQMFPPGASKQVVSKGGIVKSGETVTTKQGVKEIAPDIAEFNKGFDQRVEGLKGTNEIAGRLAADRAKLLQQASINQEAEQVEIKARRETQQAEIKARMNKVSQVTDALMNAEIDPDRLWSSKNAGGKMKGVLSVMMGAASQSLTGGPNTGLAMLNKAIENDISAQKATLSARVKGVREARGMLGVARQMSNDDLEADETFRVWAKESLIQRFEQLKAMATSEDAVNQADQAIGQLRQETAKHNAVLHEKMADSVTRTESSKRVPPKTVDLRQQAARMMGYVSYVKQPKELGSYVPFAAGYALNKETATTLNKANRERKRVISAAEAYSKALARTSIFEGKLPTLAKKELEAYRSILQKAVKKEAGFGANFTLNEEKIQNQMLGTAPIELVKAIQGGKDVTLRVLIRETKNGMRQEAFDAGLRQAIDVPTNVARAVPPYMRNFWRDGMANSQANANIDWEEGSGG